MGPVVFDLERFWHRGEKPYEISFFWPNSSKKHPNVSQDEAHHVCLFQIHAPQRGEPNGGGRWAELRTLALWLHVARVVERDRADDLREEFEAVLLLGRTHRAPERAGCRQRGEGEGSEGARAPGRSRRYQPVPTGRSWVGGMDDGRGEGTFCRAVSPFLAFLCLS